MAFSILTPAQRALLRVVVALSFLMIANAAFLLLFRATEASDTWRLPADTLPAFYQSMVLGHTLVGLIVAPLAILFALWHLRAAWRMRHPIAIWTGVGLIVLSLVLVLSGFLIMTEANSIANRPWYWTHIALGVLLPGIYAWHRITSANPPKKRSVPVTIGAALGVGLFFTFVHIGTIPGIDDSPDGSGRATVMAGLPSHDDLVGAVENGEDPFIPFVPYNDVDQESPFFPSPATTATGNLMPSRVVTRGELPDPEQLRAEVEAHGFVKDYRIGAATCARCHPDIVEQWAVSSHRFSSMNNPFYRAPFEDMQEVPADRQRAQWCSGCHEPALMQAGEVVRGFDPLSANAQAGLTCLACHAIDSIHNNTGNGNYNLPDHKESPYLFDEAESDLGRWLGDTIIKAKPNVHKSQMLKPFFRTSEYCATCHKVALDTPLNGYKWLRGQNEYDAWHDSGVARNAARTFYLPGQARTCQDCHMPLEDAPLGDFAAKDGKVRSHRFLSVNTALPALRGDTDSIERIEKDLQDGKMRVDLFSLRRLNADGEESEWIPALDVSRPVLQPGELVEVRVVVRNKGVGHTFPGGTNDSNEAWIEMKVSQDGRAEPWFHSGFLDEGRHLDPAAERYGVLMIDHEGEIAGTRNAQDFHTPVYAKVIGPGTADIVRYQFRVPESAAGGELTLDAALNWRKFNRRYTEYVFEGKEVPNLPITAIAWDQLTLRVAAAGEAVAATDATVPGDQWMRFNDLGIGLLLDGDTRGAARAFNKVAELVPERVDGPRNLARVLIRDGHLEEAHEWLMKAEELKANDPQTAWVWGNLLMEDGRYIEAAQAFRRVLVAFPDDRDTHSRLGRVLYLDGKFEDSITAFLQTLRIDPENASAHYHRMLCYRGLGRLEEAAAAETAYLKYKNDEHAAEITRRYRLENPEAQLLSQPIHVHLLSKAEAETPEHEGTH